MIPGPVFVLLTPLLMAPIVYLLRRLQPVAALIAGLTTLLLSWTTYSLPLDQPARVGRLLIDLGEPLPLLDRPLLIEANDQPVLGFIFLVATVLFWFAWHADHGPLFFPLGLAVLSLFSAVLLMQPFQYAALLLTIAAALAAFLIQGGRAGTTQAALRYLVMAVIALPPILVAGWELEKFVDTPDEVSLLATAAVLFACTFAVLLSSVPFHGWVPAVGAEAPPLVAALMFVVGQSVVIAWLLSLLDARPQLLRYLDVYLLLRLAGLSMVSIGALLAFSRATFGRLMGYAALVDMGAVLMALGLGNDLGLQAATMTLVLRALGLTLSAAGLTVLRGYAQSDAFDRVRGLAWRFPFATTALLLGGLSLAGFPLTPGFVGRWALVRLLAQHDPTLALVLFLAGMSVALGYMRGLGALLAPPTVVEAAPESAELIEPAAALEAVPAPATQPRRWWQLPRLTRRSRPKPPRAPRRWLPWPRWQRPFDEPILTTMMLVLGVAVCLAVAVAPQLILPWVGQVAGGYALFGS